VGRVAKEILDVLFPQVRAKLLRVFFGGTPKLRYVRELRNITGLSLHTVQDELRKLAAVGLVSSWSNGYHRFYQANANHPLVAQLMQIVDVSAKLPKTKHSALRRQAGSRTNKKRTRLAPRPLPSDRPVRWHVFSKSTKTRRL
jgi:predicted transcriptional regulator